MPEQAPALNGAIFRLAGELAHPCCTIRHMVLAYHPILSCYGFWLPNDPRGSWSDEVRRYELLRFGPATKVNTRRSVAGIEHDYALRKAAKATLKYEPVTFNGRQARAVVRGFADVCAMNNYEVHACAVMADHVHLVIARHPTHKIEPIARRLKAKGTQQLNKENLGFGRSPWALGEWKVFLDTPRAIRRAIRYVERNPTRAGHKPQTWNFVTPYVGG